MTTPAAKPTRKPRQDAYVAKLAIHIPLNPADPKSFENAVNAIGAIKATLPEGSTVEIAGGFGKMPVG